MEHRDLLGDEFKLISQRDLDQVQHGFAAEQYQPLDDRRQLDFALLAWIRKGFTWR